MRRANIFHVEAGRPFLEALARAILDGNLPSSGGAKPSLLDLPAMTILLPTRRASRALQEAFLKVSGGRAMLLPAIRPIAEGDEDLGLIEEAASGRQLAEGGDLPPAVGRLERQLALTQLVQAWSQAMRRDVPGAGGGERPVASAGAGTPAQAARLAHELAALMDTVETENVTLAALEGLVPEALSEHWQQTLQFLEILGAHWPVFLSERGRLSPMERRNRLILDEARRLADRPPAGPVIIAGVTGSIPATAELMRVVLSLPNGAIVLPALDMTLDEASWQRILDPQSPHHDHPQYGFRHLLDRLGLAREDIRPLPGAPLPPARVARNRLVSEAMRPSGSLEHWRAYLAAADRGQVRAALGGLSLIEAPTAEDEAEAVALILREAAETPGRTAALVSPDRLLARRVAIRLESWGIRVDDSAGRPFGKTVPGAFLDLVVNAWATEFAPAELMALLKHPLARLGLPAGIVRRAARNLELAAFRAPYLGRGLDALDRAVERASHGARDGSRRHATVRRLGDQDWAAIRDLVQRLIAAFAPLIKLSSGQGALTLAELARAHAAVAEAIAAPSVKTPAQAGGKDSQEDGSPLWLGEAGEVAERLLEALGDATLPAPALTAADYPDFYRMLIAGETVRPRVPVHPRLFIWGPYEARLQQTDVMILGSLNEATWPKAADPGAWLNRPMRKALGLPAPEVETGRAAHDLSMFLGADMVILTRADKVDGVPRVPSRWLLRLKALLDGMGVLDALAPEKPWLAWARARDHVTAHRPVAAPEPRPAVALRPRQASVSDIETWIANPYAIFARRVLRLEPLPALGGAPGPQEKGQVIHEALSRFTQQHAETLPGDIAGALLAAARDVLGDFESEARVRAFWLPRLTRFADWLAATEPERRRGIVRLLAELPASHVLDAPAGPFKLTARADRIDVGERGLVITDYKTGQIPSTSHVGSGAAPQLPLEAALVIAGAFAGLDAMPVDALRYIRVTGAEPPGEEKIIKVSGGDVAALAEAALEGVRRLVAEFDREATPYRAVRRPRFRYDYDDYAHLARVGEWGIDEGEDGEAAA